MDKKDMNIVVSILATPIVLCCWLGWRSYDQENDIARLRVDVMSLHFATTAVVQEGANPLCGRGQVAVGILRQAIVERWKTSPVISDRDVATLASRSLAKADEAIRAANEKKK